jgi:hypothetical protein
MALARHIIIESSARVVSRRARWLLTEELKKVRAGSFPFVSADTFRGIADVIIEDNRVKRKTPIFPKPVVYFDLTQLENSQTPAPNTRSKGIRQLLELAGSNFDDGILILNNADIPPSSEELAELAEAYRHVFCTNIVVESRKISAIPVGLENSYRNTNGVIYGFEKFRSAPSTRRRSTRVLAYFNVGNNQTIRGPLARQLAASRFGWSSKRIDPRRYRSLVKETKFVISPPGNGIDCHRTWEAIYLGAIPVVMKDQLADSLVSALPILAVAHYDDFLSLGDDQLDALYTDLSKVSADRAFMPYWLQKIWELTGD